MKRSAPLLHSLLLVIGWFVVIYLYIDYTLESPVRDDVVELVIPPQTSVSEIGQLLEEKNLIRDDLFFLLYVYLTDQRNLIAGVYEIEPNHDLPMIMQKITSGKQDLVKVTIPEGWNIYDIADHLEKLGFDREGFLKEVDRQEAKVSIEEQIKDNEDRTFKLEGYLYPSTYHFQKDATPEIIVNEMVKEFEKRWHKINGPELMEKGNLTLDEAVIFASLVEKESINDEERARIAGVIYNRLRKPGFALNIDASTIYAIRHKEGKILKSLTENDYRYSSPYNLYQSSFNKEYPAETRLPPGPIANPSENSLKAVLTPEKHDYLYYQTKIDNPKEHIFFETKEEHEAYSRKKRAMR